MFNIEKKGKSKEVPQRITIFGLPKTGKTTFASQAPDVFFLNAEDGLSYLSTEVAATPKLKTFDEVIGWLKHIYESEKFEYKTIAVDSLDWIESLAQDKLIKQYNAKSITDSKVSAFAYYRGVVEAATMTMEVFSWLDAIYKKHGVKTIIICHSQIKTVELPNKDPFQRSELKLSKYLSSKLMEWSDIILHADYSFYVTSDGKTSEPKRVLFTGESAAFLGGSRMKLPKELPISYIALEKAITQPTN